MIQPVQETPELSICRYKQTDTPNESERRRERDRDAISEHPIPSILSSKNICLILKNVMLVSMLSDPA